MLIHQELHVLPNGRVHLRNVDDDLLETKEAHDTRQAHYDADNPKGWSKGKMFMQTAAIPQNVYLEDPLCLEYQRQKAAGNMPQAKRTLRLFLQMNPQYRASEAKI